MFIDLDWQDLELGQGITCKIKPLEIEAYQMVMAYFKKSGLASVGQGDELNPDTAFEAMSSSNIVDLIKHVIPTHVKDLDGIEFKYQGERRKATAEDMAQHSQFVVINVQILGQLISISSIAGTSFAEDKEQEAGITPEQIKKPETELLPKE